MGSDLTRSGTSFRLEALEARILLSADPGLAALLEEDVVADVGETAVASELLAVSVESFCGEPSQTSVIDWGATLGESGARTADSLAKDAVSTVSESVDTGMGADIDGDPVAGFAIAEPVDDDGEPDPGLLTIGDLRYEGAFRLSSKSFGDSSTNYASGKLAYNPERHSLFVAGHATQYAVAEFAIPEPSLATEVGALPVVEKPLQPFVSLLDSSPEGNPEGLDRITGLLWLDGQLIVNAEGFYAAGGDHHDTTLVVRDADNLAGSVDGYFEIEGASNSAGYMASIPARWQESFGGTHLTGWSSVHAIMSRYSVGPSLWVFDPDEITRSSPGIDPSVAAIPFMNFAYSNGEFLAEDALKLREGSASAVWNYLSEGVYGLIVPGSSTFVVIGSAGGIDHGSGYTSRHDDGRRCGGYCSHAADDDYNYYWLFDVREILAAENAYEPRPYAYGRWSLPFDQDGAHKVVGATFDSAERVVYIALGGAGQSGEYDRPPLILTYRIDDVGGRVGDGVGVGDDGGATIRGSSSAAPPPGRTIEVLVSLDAVDALTSAGPAPEDGVATLAPTAGGVPSPGARPLGGAGAADSRGACLEPSREPSIEAPPVAGLWAFGVDWNLGVGRAASGKSVPEVARHAAVYSQPVEESFVAVMPRREPLFDSPFEDSRVYDWLHQE